MTDLAALNAAVQADKGANKSVKAWIAAATPLIQPPAPPPPSYPFVPDAPVVTTPAGNTAQWFRDVAHPSTVANIHVNGAPDYGVAIMGYFPNPAPSPSAFLVRDVIGENVGHEPPTMNGTGEAGLWFGTQVDVDRAYGEGTWMGVWTGANCFDSTFTNFKAYGPRVGLYLEHVTRDCTFSRFDIKGGTNSVNVEWWYGGQGSSGCHFDTGSIYCPAGGYGFYADAGTYGFRLSNITFYGPGAAGAWPRNLVDPTKPNVVDGSCVFLNTGGGFVFHDHAIG